jgi:hypothetical protein
VEVLLLALEAAVYPTLIAAAFILLTQPRPRRLLASYLFAGLAISITAGLVIVLALKGSNVFKTSSSGPSWVADLTAGVLALAAALALYLRLDESVRRRRAERRLAAGKAPRKKEPSTSTEEPWSQRILGRGSMPIVIGVSLVLNLPGAAYLIGLKDIATGGHSTATVVSLIVAFNLIMFLFAEVPLLGLLFAPERTTELVGRFNTWLIGHGREVATVLLLIFGIYLTTRGISNS